MSKLPSRELADYSTCGFCKDKGITFDDFNSFRFCTCVAGAALMLHEPDAVSEANQARLKVQGIGAKR